MENKLEKPKTIKFIIIKSLDIGITLMLFLLAGMVVGYLIDAYLWNTDNDSQKGLYHLMAEVSLYLGGVGVLSYYARNIAEQLGSPFDGADIDQGEIKYSHSRIKELNGAIFGALIITMSSVYSKKIQ